MKYFCFIISLLCIVTSSFSMSDGQDLEIQKKILSYELIDDSNGISIVRVSDGEFAWYQAIGTIATFALPKTAEAICLLVSGDKDICDAVYEGVSALVSFKGKKICRGISKGFYWFFERDSKNSKFIFEAATQDKIFRVKKLMDLYNDEDIINWSKTNTLEIPSSSSLSKYDTPIQELDNLLLSELNMSGNVAGYATYMHLEKDCEGSYNITGYYYYTKYRKRIKIKGHLEDGRITLKTYGQSHIEEFNGVLSGNKYIGSWKAPNNRHGTKKSTFYFEM